MAEGQCPKCGSAAVSPTGLCTQCGTALWGTGTAPAVHRTSPPDGPSTPAQPIPVSRAGSGASACPECGAATDESSAFCPWCGTALGGPPETLPSAAGAASPGWADGLPGAVTARRPPWALVWVAAALTAAAALVVAGASTSWFGLAGADDEVAYSTTTHAAASTTSGGTAGTAADATTHTTQGAVTTNTSQQSAATTTTSTMRTTTTQPWYAVRATTACVVGSPGGLVNVRSGPSDDTREVGGLAYNATGIGTTGWAALDENDEEWRQVVYDGQEAWVHSYYLSPGECWVSSPQQYCVNNYNPPCTNLNVRIGPGDESWPTDEWLAHGYEVIGEWAYNDVNVSGSGVIAVDHDGETWIQVWHNGHLGWSAQKYLVPQPCTPACP